MNIKVNGKSLEEYLDDEKVKEIKYDLHIQVTKHHRYQKPADKTKVVQARSGRAKTIKSNEELFMHAFDRLDDDIQDMMANATRSQQGKIWRKWVKATKTWPLHELLANIIKEVI